MSHLRGVATALRERFSIPVVFYDGDVPMSLPEFGGMDTGFNYYHGADPGEYDLVISNSEGGLERLARARRAARRGDLLGRRSRALPAAAGGEDDRRLLLRLRREVPRRLDRADGRRAEPAGFPTMTSRSAATTSGATSGPRVTRAMCRSTCSRAQFLRHASTSTSRASRMQPCRSRPRRGRSSSRRRARPSSRIRTKGIERWFEPGKELIVVESADEAVAAYEGLLADPAQAEELGRAARERALDEHTYVHRARQLLELVGIGPRASVATHG